jgi:hypothetical protein
VLQAVVHLEISCLGAPSLFMVAEAQKSHGARSGLYGGCSNGVPPIHFFQAEHRIQFRSRLIQFLGFSSHEKGAPRQEISKWSTVCSTFSRSGWGVVRSESLAEGGTSKKRPSPHLHKVPTRSNKVSPRTLQMALLFLLFPLQSIILPSPSVAILRSSESNVYMRLLFFFEFYARRFFSLVKKSRWYHACHIHLLWSRLTCDGSRRWFTFRGTLYQSIESFTADSNLPVWETWHYSCVFKLFSVLDTRWKKRRGEKSVLKSTLCF